MIKIHCLLYFRDQIFDLFFNLKYFNQLKKVGRAED